MAAQPPRRTDPTPHLGAHIVPVERALRARADRLDAIAHALVNNVEGEDPAVLGARAEVRRAMAAEFRALADELHHW